MPELTTTNDVSHSGSSNASNNRLCTAPANAGFLAGAVGTDARHGTFNDNSHHLTVTYGHRSSETTEVLASLKPVDRRGYYVPRCMDGTRESTFEEIDKWLADADDPNILWLSGSPGAGKSTIASSMVSRLTERRKLGASFFFRREDVTLNDPATLWCTMAYDLSQHDPAFANNLVETLTDKRVDLERPDIDLHFKYLIEEPMTKTYKHSTPPVIVIDALDECDADHSQAVQRKALLKTFVQWSHLPNSFKLIVTGRDDRVPEFFRAVCKGMVLPTGDDVSADANRDLRRFFEERFAELGGSLFPKWPGEQTLQKLTARAAGLFIWAETVMRLVEQGLPNEQLKLVLCGNLGEGNRLVKLYRQILDISFRNAKGRTLEVYKLTITAIVLAKIPLHYDNLHFFVSEDKLSVKFVLDKLSSVISIGTTDKRLRIRHLSFSEFLCDPNQCPQAFLIDPNKGSHVMAIKCLQRMKDGLKFNICDLETSYLRNDEVENLSERIQIKISDTLSYTCRYWAAHLRNIRSAQEGHDALLQEVKGFFYNRFLFWLEVMSLLKQTLAANSALLAVIPWIEKFDSDLSAFARDASRFIINFDIPISDSLPHIYLSALPFLPSESLIAQRYKPQFASTLSVVSGRKKDWPAMVNLFRGHTGGVMSVAFSPDGKRVVSGSSDNTIRIWDAETGRIAAGPFNGHTDRGSVMFSQDGKRVVSGSDDKTVRIWNVETGQITVRPFKGRVLSVAFSKDGQRVVSGSSDKTICVWDPETGQSDAGPFTGHTDGVTSVAFSPDGKRVVSGSFDTTIRIWDAETGMITAGPLERHTDWIRSVMFSPDGKRVVSGSSDKTICIWDAETGHITSDPFKGHKDWVHSVAFSQDGKRVVSGSSDTTICIWDVKTGLVTADPFEGHTNSVTSVAFSPDGKHVVSGSSDSTIRIWDIETRKITTAPDGGHTHWVTSVGFSSEGNRIVSGSSDKTIRIWNADTGQIALGPFTGHTDWVTSVAFSPDGRKVVSGSFDNTVRIWDVETGKTTRSPLQGHTHWINTVAFSPDGKRVASGSFDKTIRVWDVETNQIIAGPFKGHTDWINSVAFSPDGMRIVSGSKDGTIRVWNAATGRLTIGLFEGHTDSVASVMFSPDGKRVVSGSKDCTICIWDVKTGKVAKDPFKGHTRWVTSVAFSPNGKWVVSGSSDTTLHIWDTGTGQTIASPFRGHLRSITSVSFSPNGKRVVSGSGDGTIRVWDMEILHSQMENRIDVPNPVGDLYHLNPTSGWSLLSDGDCKDRLLFWTPQSSRLGLCGNRTAVLIGGDITRLDFSRFVHGKSWTRCYSPEVFDTLARTNAPTSLKSYHPTPSDSILPGHFPSSSQSAEPSAPQSHHVELPQSRNVAFTLAFLIGFLFLFYSQF